MKTKFQDFIAPLSVSDISFATFYNFPHALRFELAIADDRMTRMISAFDRARAISHHILPMTLDEVYVVFRLIGGKEGPLFKQQFFETALDYLKITSDDFIDYGVTAMPDDDDGDLCCYWYGVKLKNRSYVDNFLWFPVSAEMGFEPSLSAHIYIFDRKNGILIHPYDDRGMDVIAASKQSLMTLYRDFNDWLLDYDRSAMDKNFACCNG